MSVCKYCQLQIGWTKAGEGWRPLNLDGTSHRCGRRHKKKTSEPREVVGKTVAGANYKPSCGACVAPPWEVCACSEATA